MRFPPSLLLAFLVVLLAEVVDSAHLEEVALEVGAVRFLVAFDHVVFAFRSAFDFVWLLLVGVIDLQTFERVLVGARIASLCLDGCLLPCEVVLLLREFDLVLGKAAN